ncbi:MAG: threonine/serine exporter family protein [Candidatus Nanopelagicales bacterium]
MDENPVVDPDRAELEQILQTSLEFGVQVQMSGGYTARVRDSMRRVALGLGADRAETWVSSGSIGLAVTRDGWSRTSVRTTPAMGVNFTELSSLSRLARASQGMTLEQLRAELGAIAGRDRRYPVVLVLVMLGVSCGSFAALFGADPAGIVIAGFAGGIGAATRHWLVKRRFKPFIYCLFAGFVSAAIVLSLGRFTASVDTAVTASMLFLVPGVPLLNGTADLLTSNYLNGLVRLTRASVILLGSALGLTLALAFWGHL